MTSKNVHQHLRQQTPAANTPMLSYLLTYGCV